MGGLTLSLSFGEEDDRCAPSMGDRPVNRPHFRLARRPYSENGFFTEPILPSVQAEGLPLVNGALDARHPERDVRCLRLAPADQVLVAVARVLHIGVRLGEEQAFSHDTKPPGLAP